MIHVMAVSRLGGTAMSAPVVSYDPIAMLEEEQHLRVPIISRQRPAVAEDHRLPFAPILIINLCSVFSGDGCHWISPSLCFLIFVVHLPGLERASYSRFRLLTFLGASG